MIDTCVLAELRRPDGHPGVKARVIEIGKDSFLSVLTLGEIAKGVRLLPPGSAKRRALSTWLNGLESAFAARILPIDLETGRLWGELTARAQRSGVTIPATDGLLAATALRHGLHVLTRNTRHFEASGAMIVNPWQPG